MIKENIKVLDSLRPEEVRFNFNPLNRNLCFSGGSYTGGEGNIVDEFGGMLDAMNPFKSGSSGGGDVDTEGGLSAEDKAFKSYIYSKLKPLMEQEYESYEGDRYADRSPEELELLGQLKEGGGYKELYDKAATDLGFTKQAYKDAAGYGVDQLDQDASALMAGDTYRNEVRDQILRDMNRGASMSGMDLTSKAWGSDAGGTHSRGGSGGTTRLMSNQNYLSQAGDALTRLNFGAYQDALNRARTLQQDRLGAAGRYGNEVGRELGFRTGGLDKHYSTSMGAFGQDRGYLDRDLGWDYKQWLDEKNDPYKKTAWGTGVWTNMPFEEKVVTSQPASGGK